MAQRQMSSTAVRTIADLHGGTIAARHHGMWVFSFPSERDATSFANVTGGMLIRGLERGAVDVAVAPQEVIR